MDSKPFWQSSTFWINFMGIVFIILAEAQALDLIPEDLIAYVTLVLNIINRFRVKANTDVKQITFK